MTTPTTRNYRLPPVFFFDHQSRGLPESEAAVSTLTRTTRKAAFVDLNQAGYDELLDDARYYAEEMYGAGMGFEGLGLINSARATVKQLLAQGPPVEEAAPIEDVSQAVLQQITSMFVMRRGA